MNRWSVLTSSAGHELTAVSEMMSIGIDAYCPVIKHLTKPKRKSSPIEVIQAAFPGYLFAAEGFTDFSATPYLKLSRIHHLRLGDEFCMIDETEIDRLRSEDDERTTIVDDRVRFAIGDHVRVIGGPLTSQDGLIVSTKGRHCELAIVGFTAKIYMPEFSLKKLGASTTVQ